MIVAAPVAIPSELFYQPDDPVDHFYSLVDDDDLIYFLLNVGDGDSQLIVLPKHAGRRTVLIVDAARADKTEHLLNDLLDDQAVVDRKELDVVAVATHPHADHIAGLPRLIRLFRDNLEEFWDAGYRYTGQDYERLANAIDDIGTTHAFSFSQPAAGTVRYFGSTRVTIIGPSSSLKSRFDTFGVELNDASIVIKIEFPKVGTRCAEQAGRCFSLLLGADAQTEAWANAMVEFPRLHNSPEPAAQALRMTLEATEPLSANIFKVPHHASKHGVNLELMERVSPKLTLTSSTARGAGHYFPHDAAQLVMREALQPIAASRRPVRRVDWALGMLYTADMIGGDRYAATTSAATAIRKSAKHASGDVAPDPPFHAAGSFAVVARAGASARVLRLCDTASAKRARLSRALRYLGPGASAAGVPRTI